MTIHTDGKDGKLWIASSLLTIPPESQLQLSFLLSAPRNDGDVDNEKGALPFYLKTL